MENCSSSDFTELYDNYTQPQWSHILVAIRALGRLDHADMYYLYVLYTHVHIKMLNINAARVSFKFSMARTEQQRNYIAVYFVYEPVVILLEYFSILLHCWLLQAQCVFDCIN